MKRLIILDRDGVINQDAPNSITEPQAWQALPGSLNAIARLCRAEYRVAVITNQSGIGKGLFSFNTLNLIHKKMLEELRAVGGEISAIFFCPHVDADDCECRKPKPGMFHDLAARLNYDLSETFAVGDSLRDLQAAQSAGAKPVLVETGNGRANAKALGIGASVGVGAGTAERGKPSRQEAVAARLVGALSTKQRAQLQDTPVYADLASFVDALLAKQRMA